jgi:hypothetical protein
LHGLRGSVRGIAAGKDKEQKKKEIHEIEFTREICLAKEELTTEAQRAQRSTESEEEI